MKTPDELAAIAVQMVTRIRDEHPEVNGRWLANALPDPEDRWALCFVLAAAVPDDRSWTDLTEWANDLDEAKVIPIRVAAQSGGVQPCGTVAAARRHRYYAEPICDPCRDAERVRDRKRRRFSRAGVA